MLSGIVAQLSVGHGPLANGSSPRMPIASEPNTVRDGETVVLDTDRRIVDEFTTDQLLQKRKKNEKSTQAQQTFAVGLLYCILI